MSTVASIARPAPCPFGPGDVVALKSGGACMTVRSVTPARTGAPALVAVDWHSDFGEPYEGEYPAAMLCEPPEEEAAEPAA
jgi:uncharacterized protein YodC (DUF2158 family)